MFGGPVAIYATTEARVKTRLTLEYEIGMGIL